MSDTTDYDRLADYVLSRRTVLGIDRAGVAGRMGVSTKTVERIELSRSVRSGTLAKLELALGWTPGSARRVLDGGEPTLVEQEESVPDLRDDIERAIWAYDVLSKAERLERIKTYRAKTARRPTGGVTSARQGDSA
jgi:transcriptional regulator with XRE-family HTH domain